MLDELYYRYDGYDLHHDDKQHKTTVMKGSTVVTEVPYKIKQKTIDRTEEVFEGFFNQNVYKQHKHIDTYTRCDKSVYTETYMEKIFDRKLPKPSYPMAPRDCIVKDVYTDKYHSKHNYYNDVPLLKGERFPKKLEQGHGWRFYIGDSFRAWLCNRTGGDRTTYCEWGDVVKIEGYGEVPLIW